MNTGRKDIEKILEVIDGVERTTSLEEVYKKRARIYMDMAIEAAKPELGQMYALISIAAALSAILERDKDETNMQEV